MVIGSPMRFVSLVMRSMLPINMSAKKIMALNIHMNKMQCSPYITRIGVSKSSLENSV